MALAHHDAAHRHQRQRADAELFRAQDRGDDDIASGLEAAVGAQLDAPAQAVERQRLIDLAQAHFPRGPRIFDAGLRGGSGAADMPCDQDDVGMGLGHACCHRADPGRGDELDAHPRDRIDLLQVIDELRQILDRIDVMVRRRRDQRHARRRMAQLGDELGHLEAGQLPAFAGLCALRDLDFDLVAGVEIFRRHAKATAGDLLHPGIGVVAIGIGLIARAVLAAFARHRLGTDAVHRDGERFMRFGAERAQRHARRHETLADLGDRLDLIDRHALGGEIELQQIAQIDRRQPLHPARELQIGRIAVGRDRGLQQVHELCGICVRFAGVTLAIETPDRQRCHRRIIGLVVPQLRVEVERGIALARNLRGHPREQVVHQSAAEADRLEIIATAIAGDHGDPHLRHDLEQALVDRRAMPFKTLFQRQISKQAARMAIDDRGLGQIGVDRGRADADQHRIIMRVEAFGGLDVDAGIRAQAHAHEMGVHGGGSEDAGDADAVRADRHVGQEQFALALAHGGHRFGANARNCATKGLGTASRIERAVDFCRLCAEMRLQLRPGGAVEHGRLQHQHAIAPILGVEDVGKVAEARLERHHMAFA
ncbi:hypothetical protein D9M73_100880 [compost metagenome]